MPDSKYIPVVQPLAPVDSPLRGLPPSRARLIDTSMSCRFKTAPCLTAVVALVLAAVAGTVSAQVTMLAPRPCGKWVENQAMTDVGGMALRTGDEAWLAGFLSGVTVALNVNLLTNVDKASVVLWMTNYCRANPLSNTGTGAQILFNELQRATRTPR
jgi:hypothetical protein